MIFWLIVIESSYLMRERGVIKWKVCTTFFDSFDG
ncbi:hypothetical protein ANAEL_00876 [Anaerolineales bacterium]|nr:hypothetical protein ANAEL_00876 [Anaerolineales bacterium]